MFLSVFKISGHSMMPTFSPNEKVLASSLPFLFSGPKKNDIVIFKHGNKFLVKRVKSFSNGKYFLEGDNKNDNLRIPLLSRKQILGKVVRRI